VSCSPRRRRQGRLTLALIALIALLAVACGCGGPNSDQPRPSAGGSWATYLGNNTHSGFQAAKQPGLMPASPFHLKLLWSSHAAGPISAQPVVANGLTYWGSWDGYERATDRSGQTVWKTFLGTTPSPFDSGCLPAPIGVANSPTVTTLGARAVLYVGGTNTFYALDALTGQVVWKTVLSSANGAFLWSSPALYKGTVYEGVSSWGDCPLVQGQLVAMSATDGSIQHTFNVVPSGCVGATVWGSPTVDEAAASVYFATGNAGQCSSDEPLGSSLIRVAASDLTLQSAWAAPLNGTQAEWGSTPTLFAASVNGVQRSLLGLVDKNGSYYAFDRSKPFSLGPAWAAVVSEGGEDPESGHSSISPSAWDGTALYVAGGMTSIKGRSCQGSLRAVNPSSGRFVWELCLTNPVLGAVAAVEGLAVVGSGPDLLVIATSSGQVIFSYHHATTAHLNQFWGAASISGGVIYAGNMDGTLLAFGSS
jgi:outer membrane protein assembly factor BamB